MTGRVDDESRALIRVPVAAGDGPRRVIEAWVDTGFNGGLTIPRPLIAGLGLTQAQAADVVLADGRVVTLKAFVCILDWFGKTYETQVFASDAAHPLLGMLLLAAG